jgi:hypothetical protein
MQINRFRSNRILKNIKKMPKFEYSTVFRVFFCNGLVKFGSREKYLSLNPKSIAFLEILKKLFAKKCLLVPASSANLEQSLSFSGHNLTNKSRRLLELKF